MQAKYLYIIVIAAALLLAGYVFLQPATQQPQTVAPTESVPTLVSNETLEEIVIVHEAASDNDDAPVRAVLDISVHTFEGLKVLFDRAEELAMRPQAKGEDAEIVLVLHGPEVEFFSIKNYDKYKDIVDQAARLDAFDVVDVKICQTMMGIQGVERDDIPAFIEQVPLGSEEINRLVEEGYVSF